MNTDYFSYETLIAARDSAYWAKLSMYGTWFAGAATFAAVLVALRRPVPRIRGQATIIIASPPPYDNPTYGVGVSINNIGTNPVKINSLIWKFSKDTRVMYLTSQPGDTLPKRIEHGDSASFFFLDDEEGEWLADLKKWNKETGGKAKQLRIEVTLGTGDVFYIRPRKDVLDFINKK